MPMSRDDMVIVAAPGDYAKPRPAVIEQSNAVPESHASIVICQLTSELVDADFRITIEPGRKRDYRCDLGDGRQAWNHWLGRIGQGGNCDTRRAAATSKGN
jgi:hypothetical protein